MTQVETDKLVLAGIRDALVAGSTTIQVRLAIASYFEVLHGKTAQAITEPLRDLTIKLKS